MVGEPTARARGTAALPERLDAAREPELDAAARLTALLLEVPIALICLVDGERAWCEAHHGPAASGIGRELSSSPLVAARAPLVVDDALIDPRLEAHPLVTGPPYVRFYAGMPVLGPDGRLLGTLCALDHRARAVTDVQLDALRLMAGQVAALLEPRRREATPRAHRPTPHEAELAARERRLQTGTLAAGVGHEINNPLTYVLTNLELAIEELDVLAAGNPSRRLIDVTAMLREAREGGERVKRIVRGLKALACDDTPVVATDINVVVHHALELASHELRTHVTVALELADGVFARVDPARLAQVLINLLVNAAQAFGTADPSRNRITLRTRIDHGAIIEIADNGPGIAADVLPRIFDPFYTTKAPGTGAGLGLAISHGIVAALAGELTCESRAGAGAMFRVALPAVVAPARKPEAVASVRQGRLLVVDDEAAILKTVTRMFRGELDVVALDNPRVALRRLEAGEPFDVVLCDLTMPYLSGMQLHTAVAARAPRLAARFVFLSGDLTRDDIREFLDGVPNERFEKPFDVQELRGIVRRFLAGESPSVIMG